MARQCINPKGLFPSTQYGFSQIAVSHSGKMVFISGQVAWDENMEIVGQGELKTQTQKAFENLKTAIEAAGGSLDDIVMLRLYIVNYQAKNGVIISEVLKENFGTENPPASTWINVQGLANEDFIIEVEAQAVI